MNRRAFITLLGSAPAAWAVPANAQQTAKLSTIGYLGPNSRSLDSQRLAAFVQRLRELGWIEDRTITIEYRWAPLRERCTNAWDASPDHRFDIHLPSVIDPRVIVRDWGPG